jgi:hypothetical protein
MPKKSLRTLIIFILNIHMQIITDFHVQKHPLIQEVDEG